MTSYAATSQGITVTATPVYLDGQSDAIQHKFVFAYFILIRNNREEEVQLLRRHWYIHDSCGDVKEVEGEGVVGKQPVLRPGEEHAYNSFCVLETFEGFMEGTYLMQSEHGEPFTVTIPRFHLRAASN
jgi:ApaG protein